MANQAGDTKPKFKRGHRVRASSLQALSDQAIYRVVGGRGISVKVFRDTILIENTAPSCGGSIPAPSSGASAFEIGDTILKWKDDAEVIVNGFRWLNCCYPIDETDTQTVGDTSSGATAWASADAEDLFTYLWTNFETRLTIQDSSGTPTSRGASAAADFAAHKRMPLPDLRDRPVVGMGYNNTAIGTNDGLAYNGRSASASHFHGVTGVSTASDGSHNHTIPELATGSATGWNAPATQTTALTVAGSLDDPVIALGSDVHLYIDPDPHSHLLDTSTLGHGHSVASGTYSTGTGGSHTHGVSGSVDTTVTPLITGCWFILAEVP